MKNTLLFLFTFSIVIFITNSFVFANNWTQAGLPNDGIVSLATQSNGFIYAGTSSNGLYRSTDGGSNWVQVLSPPSVYKIFSITFDLSNNVLVGTYSNGLFKSFDNGENWINLSTGNGSNQLPITDIYSVTVSKLNGYIFALAGTGNAGYIYRSMDDGQNWESVFLPNGGFQFINSNNSGNIYACGAAWFYYSNDDGNSWTFRGSSSGLIEQPNFVAMGDDSSTVYVSTIGGGIFITHTNGLDWYPWSFQISNPYITSLFRKDISMYTGTDDGSVYASLNSGSNWGLVELPIPGTSINSLTVNEYYLFAGTSNKGIWKYPKGLIPTNINDETNEYLLEYNLSQNFPNPFNPTTIISWQSPFEGMQTLKVYDVLGNEVTTLVKEYRPAGKYDIDFDASQLTSGVYFYQLQIGDFLSTKKMILVK